MSRWSEAEQCADEGFPRVSGDEPQGTDRAIAKAMFSPRERG